MQMKEASATAEIPGMRILTDQTSEFNLDEAEDIAEFQAHMQQYTKGGAFEEKMQGYTDLWLTGNARSFTSLSNVSYEPATPPPRAFQEYEIARSSVRLQPCSTAKSWRASRLPPAKRTWSPQRESALTWLSTQRVRQTSSTLKNSFWRLSCATYPASG